MQENDRRKSCNQSMDTLPSMSFDFLPSPSSLDNGLQISLPVHVPASTPASPSLSENVATSPVHSQASTSVLSADATSSPTPETYTVVSNIV